MPLGVRFSSEWLQSAFALADLHYVIFGVKGCHGPTVWTCAFERSTVLTGLRAKPVTRFIIRNPIHCFRQSVLTDRLKTKDKVQEAENRCQTKRDQLLLHAGLPFHRRGGWPFMEIKGKPQRHTNKGFPPQTNLQKCYCPSPSAAFRHRNPRLSFHRAVPCTFCHEPAHFGLWSSPGYHRMVPTHGRDKCGRARLVRIGLSRCSPPGGLYAPESRRRAPGEECRAPPAKHP